jgi:hypothetical protein
MRGIIHLIIAFIISIIILPIGFIYSICKRVFESIDSYTYSCAYNINRLGAHVCADLFNYVLINKKSKLKYLFGKSDFTISYHIGRNLQFDSLSKIGKALNFFLNLIEKDHCIKAVKNES